MPASQNQDPTLAAPQDPSAQIRAELATSLRSADSAAAEVVANLKFVQQARLSQLKRTTASFTAKYGSGDSRTQTAQSAADAVTNLVARVAILQQQVGTPEPQVAAAGWALHGRVFDAQMQPVAAHTVFLVDAQNTYQQAYGFAYTDPSGYFLLNFAGAPGAAAPTTEAPAALSQATPQLFLQIADPKAQPVYLSATAFQPELAGAIYQNIILPAGGKSLGNPPAGIRNVALPKTPAS
jgi:hypothetical protein